MIPQDVGRGIYLTEVWVGSANQDCKILTLFMTNVEHVSIL